MKNKKGFTLVEVIVSIVLVSIILVSMLTTLVKLKELYSEVHEDSDALVYSSSIARIINNDIMENNGIRYASCNSQGDVCDIILGNDNKRKLEIVTKTSSKTEPDGKGTIRSLNSVSTLRYIDTTDPSDETMVYVRTLEANIYTTYDQSGNMKYTTSDGFNFNRMSLDQYEQDTSDGKKDVVTSLKVNIYDGIDETDQNFSAMIYGSGRYDDSGYRGRVFRIELDDNGSDTYRGTAAIDEVFGIGYFNVDTTHNLDETISEINPPKKDGWMFAGYYHNTGAVNPVAIVDSEGNIVASSTHFLGDEIITNGVGKVQALWEQCKGGYEYNRDTGECKQKTYLVEFDKHGGTGGTNSITAKYRVLVPTVNVPSRPGYMFNGYFTSPNGAGKKYIDASGKGTGIWLEAEWANTSKLHASWTARNDTPYKVVHWRQNIDAADAENSTNYTSFETENKVGTTDTKVTPPVKSYVGFTAPATKQITIAGDGSAVVNYYYKRNKYTVTVTKGTGISSVSGGGTYHYEKSISINANMNAGYSWNRWTNSSGGQVTTTRNYTFNVSGDVTYTANATANTNTAYTVKHYKQNLALNGYDLANTDSLTGTTDTSVTPGRKTYEGFTAPAAKTITVKGDGSGLVEYYYTRNSYYLDVNGELDGTTSGNTSGFGTFDVTVNGTKVADDKTDHYAQYPYGSNYTVNDIKPATGKANIGNSSFSGTIGAGTATVVIKLKTSSFKCDAGTYLPANTTTCAACPAGSFCTGGTFTMSTSDQGKSGCPSGYTSAANATANTSCYMSVAAGKYKTSATGSATANCGAGTYSGAHTSYYNKTDSCTGCPSGYTSAGGAKANTECYIAVTAGKYKTSATGSSTDNCGTGKFSTAHNSYYNKTDSCTGCPSGYTSDAGANAQTKCYINVDGGKYKSSLTGTTTAKCAAGTYKAAHKAYYNVADSCTACPSGQTSAEGSSSCTAKQKNCFAATGKSGIYYKITGCSLLPDSQFGFWEAEAYSNSACTTRASDYDVHFRTEKRSQCPAHDAFVPDTSDYNTNLWGTRLANCENQYNTCVNSVSNCNNACATNFANCANDIATCQKNCANTSSTCVSNCQKTLNTCTTNATNCQSGCNSTAVTCTNKCATNASTCNSNCVNNAVTCANNCQSTYATCANNAMASYNLAALEKCNSNLTTCNNGCNVTTCQNNCSKTQNSCNSTCNSNKTTCLNKCGTAASCQSAYNTCNNGCNVNTCISKNCKTQASCDSAKATCLGKCTTVDTCTNNLKTCIKNNVLYKDDYQGICNGHYFVANVNKNGTDAQKARYYNVKETDDGGFSFDFTVEELGVDPGIQWHYWGDYCTSDELYEFLRTILAG